MHSELIEIESGDFIAGSDEKDIETITAAFRYAFADFCDEEVRAWLLKQCPAVAVAVSTFSIAKYPVTNDEFGIYELDIFSRRVLADSRKPHAPVEGVGFYDSIAYCQWASLRDGIEYRLPTEWEWEFAASSRGKFLFPWGNNFDKRFANTAESERGSTSDVQDHVMGSSEQGVCDMAGNVEEWTSTMYLPYPGGTFVHDRISGESGGVYPVLRGGSYAHHGDLCLAKRRHGYRPNYSVSGFRVATSQNDASRRRLNR
jgi:toxoflavin biosynthesis protein ToxD